MQSGPTEILQECFRIRAFLQRLQHLSSKNGFARMDQETSSISSTMAMYAGYLIRRANFHHEFRMIEGNFSVGSYLYEQQREDVQFSINEWRKVTRNALDQMLQFVTSLAEIGDAAIRIDESQRSPRDADDSASAMDQFRQSVVIPVIDDMYAIFLTSTYLLGLLRLNAGKQGVHSLIGFYRQQYSVIHQFFSSVQHLPIVVELNRIPPLPPNCPKLSSRTAVTESVTIPLQSNVPNVGSINDALCSNFKKQLLSSHRHASQQHASVKARDLPSITRLRHKSIEYSPERAQTDPPSRSARRPEQRPRTSWDDSSIGTFQAFDEFDDFDAQFSHVGLSENDPKGRNRRPKKPEKDKERSRHAQQRKSRHRKKNQREDSGSSASGSSAQNGSPPSSSRSSLNPTSPRDLRALQAQHEAHPQDASSWDRPIRPSFGTAFVNNKTGVDSGRQSYEFPSKSEPSSDIQDEFSESPFVMVEDSWRPFPTISLETKEDSLLASALETDQGVIHLNSDDDELVWEDLQLSERIGIGGFAEVFKGKWLGAEVAVKKLINQRQTPESLDEFRSEVAIMRKLQHANITMFMGACTVPPHLCLVTELLEMSLFDLLHNTSIPLPWRIKVKMALGTARGLEFLHLCDPPILHRDLKSANILLDQHFDPRLADFGLSREKVMTTMTAQTGTFQWMSPEVISGKHYTEKADVFSFGIILWEICARKIPYEGKTGFQVSLAVVQQKARPEIDPRLCPPDWAKLMQVCWGEEPSSRPTFGEIVQTMRKMQRIYESSGH
uniref:non-specific serine/threonine protein kinase n=1 Tax=Hirondellea gigas TaxID=1518452 RepID=A0A6A7GAJ4_9CRUS